MSSNSSAMAVSLLAILFLSTAALQAEAQQFDADRIKASLQTTTLEEDGFVDRALEMVQQGRLSKGLVQSTFLWARDQSSHKFQHFKRGLLTRVANPAIRSELVTGRTPPPPSPPPSFGQTVASHLRRFFSFLPSVHTLLK